MPPTMEDGHEACAIDAACPDPGEPACRSFSYSSHTDGPPYYGRNGYYDGYYTNSYYSGEHPYQPGYYYNSYGTN